MADEVIRPSEIYEFMKGELECNNLTMEEQEKIIKNFQSLPKVRRTLEQLTQEERKNKFSSALQAMIDRTMPFDLVAFSCMAYNFEKYGIDSDLMKYWIDAEFIHRQNENGIKISERMHEDLDTELKKLKEKYLEQLTREDKN